MKLAAFLFAILSASFVQAQSLTETTAWLHDFVQVEGRVFSVEFR